MASNNNSGKNNHNPKRSLAFYWLIALLVLFIGNFLVMPRVLEGRVQEVGYETLIRMAENKEIGRVQVRSNEILFL